MKILVLTGSLFPQASNNANLLKKLIAPLTAENDVHLAATSTKMDSLPSSIENIPVHWIVDNRDDPIRRLLYPFIAKLIDPNGYSDAIMALIVSAELKAIRNEFPFDVVISTMEPFPSACAVSKLPDSVKKVVYLMDPPICTVRPEDLSPYRKRMLPKVFETHDLILTTPFIREALNNCGFGRFDHKIVEVGFPMIEYHDHQKTPDDIIMNRDKINLLFCGWLYSDIRSPRYFLDIVSRLDERFCVYFMGKECDKLRERFSFETKAQVITLPQRPYQVALNAMADADILINIGNSIPVHMPSKTLEYINTGKPMVNFHKLTDCPTLHYTNRYPLCLNLWEGEQDTAQAADKFIRFCTENKGRTVDTTSLKTQLPECTPEYIAKLILEKIGAHYE